MVFLVLSMRFGAPVPTGRADCFTTKMVEAAMRVLSAMQFALFYAQMAKSQ
jgi:hypothetical protein